MFGRDFGLFVLSTPKLPLNRETFRVAEGQDASPADDVPWPVPLLPRLTPSLGMLLLLLVMTMLTFAGLRDAFTPENEENGRDVVPGFCQLRIHLDRAEGGQRGDLGENLPWKVDEELSGIGRAKHLVWFIAGRPASKVHD